MMCKMLCVLISEKLCHAYMRKDPGLSSAIPSSSDGILGRGLGMRLRVHYFLRTVT